MMRHLFFVFFLCPEKWRGYAAVSSSSFSFLSSWASIFFLCACKRMYSVKTETQTSPSSRSQAGGACGEDDQRRKASRGERVGVALAGMLRGANLRGFGGGRWHGDGELCGRGRGESESETGGILRRAKRREKPIRPCSLSPALSLKKTPKKSKRERGGIKKKKNNLFLSRSNRTQHQRQTQCSPDSHPSPPFSHPHRWERRAT